MSGDTFTFLHAADLHIDSPLRGLVRYDGAPTGRLRSATRDAFANLVSEAVERGVAFMIIAGDVFDGDWRDYNSGLWFASELRRLRAASIPVFLLRGNHDADSKVTKKLALPDGVLEFSSKAPETVQIDELGVALHGQSFPDARVEENLARTYPAPEPGMLNIGVLHTGLEGYEGHGRYAPCTVSDLAAKRYDYWALGHIHKREIVSEDPWVVYPGNVQGRHARELGAKGATLVTVKGGRIEGLQELICDVARWVHVQVDVTGQDDEEGALDRAARALGDEVESAGERLVAARVTFTGATELDGTFRSQPKRIRSEICARGLALSPDLWVEKVRFDTTPPGADTQRGGRLDALIERVAAAEIDGDEAAQLAEELAQITSKLPPRVTERVSALDASSVQKAATSARLYLAALLSGAGDEHADGGDAR